jgi:hypothetical protein
MSVLLNAFGSLFWLGLIGVTVCALLAAIAAVMKAQRSQSKEGWLAVAFVCGLVGAGGVYVNGVLFLTNRPAAVFKVELGIPPPSDVREIRCSRYGVDNEEGALLRFETTEATFRKLLPARLAKATVEHAARQRAAQPRKNAPWWQPTSEGVTEVYFSLQPVPGGDVQILMTYNPRTGYAYYHRDSWQ